MIRSSTAHPARAAVRVAIGAAAMLLLAAAPAFGAPSPDTVHNACVLPRLAPDHVQRALIQRAALGIVPLRQYVWRTRMIHQLDLMQTVAWFDATRDAQRACNEHSGQIAADAR